jgi:hypothetical protein
MNARNLKIHTIFSNENRLNAEPMSGDMVNLGWVKDPFYSNCERGIILGKVGQKDFDEYTIFCMPNGYMIENNIQIINDHVTAENGKVLKVKRNNLKRNMTTSYINMLFELCRGGKKEPILIKVKQFNLKTSDL